MNSIESVEKELHRIRMHNPIVSTCYYEAYNPITGKYDELRWLRNSVIWMDAKINELNERLYKFISLSSSQTNIK